MFKKGVSTNKTLLILMVFLCCLGNVYAADMASSVYKSVPIDTVVLENGWMVASDAFWTAKDEIGFIAARSKGVNAQYAFMTAKPSGPASLMFPVSGPGFCRDEDGSFLFYHSKDVGSVDGVDDVLRWSSQKPLATERESSETMSHCQFRRASINSKHEAQFGGFQESLDTDGKTAVGVVRTSKEVKIVYYALDGKVLGEWPIRNIKQYWVTYQRAVNSFVVYPSAEFYYDARMWDEDQKTMPVYILNKDRVLEERSVSIGKWNDRGLALALTRTGLVASVLSLWSKKDGWKKVQPESGIYLESRDWQQIRRGYLNSKVLHVADDGCHVLWVERRLDKGFKPVKPAINDIYTANMCHE